MKQIQKIENLLVEQVVNEGKCISRHEGMVIFTEQTVPGDIVDVELYRKKKSYAEGRVINFQKRGPAYIKPFCKHFDWCGGCRWQQLAYTEQLAAKQRLVMELLQQIGKTDLPEPMPIIGSQKTTHYRNKLDYTFSNLRWFETADQTAAENKNALGFHIPQRFDRVLDIETCFLMDDMQNRIKNDLRNYVLQHGLEFFDLRKQEGLLRNLIIRNTSTGQWMVIICFARNDEKEIKGILNFLLQRFPEITTLQFVINTKRNDTISDQEVIIYSGPGYIVEKLGELKFKISPKSFFQTNSFQAKRLYDVVKDFAGLSGKELVYDLYTGTGSIANYVADSAKKVVGLEYVEQAIEDAKENSKLNEISNTIFLAGDMVKLLTADFFEHHGMPDVIITDPPRTGMHADVVKQILNAAPGRIVYVSCNAATQARDLELLAGKYRVIKIQPVDMFPHTAHVENVLLLELK